MQRSEWLKEIRYLSCFFIRFILSYHTKLVHYIGSVQKLSCVPSKLLKKNSQKYHLHSIFKYNKIFFFPSIYLSVWVCFFFLFLCHLNKIYTYYPVSRPIYILCQDRLVKKNYFILTINTFFNKYNFDKFDGSKRAKKM